MKKPFSEVEVGEIFQVGLLQYIKIDNVEGRNALRVNGKGRSKYFFDNCDVFECDIDIKLKKLTLKELDVGDKFIFNGETYIKSNSSVNKSIWIIVNEKRPWQIIVMSLDTKVIQV